MAELIISAASGDYYESIAAVTRPTVEGYAARHRREFRFYEAKTLRRPLAWGKLIAIAEALSTHDTVLWIDADVVVALDAPDIFEVMERDAWQAMVCHKTHEGGVPNTGVWLLRRAMLPSLVAAAMADDLVNHKWWEQAAILRLMGFSVDEGPCHNLYESVLYSRTQWLDEAWNVWPGASKDIKPFFRHACGLHGDQRLKAIEEWTNAAT